MASKAVPILIGLGVGGIILALSREALGTVNWGTTLTEARKKGGSKAVARTIKEAAKRLGKDVVASAKKWAKARGIPLTDVLTTIVLESRGNPQAHALSTKEDSRGLMQVNVRAHGDLIRKLGYTNDDLYKLDVGVEVGTALLAAKRAKVLELVKQSPRKQEYDAGILTRLYYAGPKYATAWILKKQHFKNMEAYVDHWVEARQGVAEAIAEGTYA